VTSTINAETLHGMSTRKTRQLCRLSVRAGEAFARRCADRIAITPAFAF